MKIPADQVYRTWTGSPALGAASQSYGLTTVNLASWMQGDTLGKSEMMILSKSLMKPSTNLCSQSNITTQNSLFDMTNDYLFEMNMTFVSKWFMTLFSRAEPFLSDASQIETARRRGRRAVISRA